MKRRTIDEMRQTARQRGGKCLSTAIVNTSTKLHWECKEGHQWWQTPNNVIHNKSWCIICAGKKQYTIDEMRELAKSKGGKCLSKEYKNANTKLLWQCGQGHKWKTTPSQIINAGSWCPYCAGVTKCTIEEMKKLAKTKGGNCLSTEYINSKTKLLWECIDGHQWPAKPNVIKTGSWCPYCQWNINEEKCRYLLEYLLKVTFPRNRTLLAGFELDGYSEELNLAFEYNGIQHFEYVKFFHSGKRSLKKIQRQDDLKEKLCREKGIKLLLIPDFAVEINGGLIKWISDGLKNLNITLRRKSEKFSFDDFPKNLSALNKLNEIALQKGGKCLSTEYINNGTKLLWECKEGHIWKSTPANVKSGKWCRKCSGYEKKTIKDMREFAKSKEGKCLSKHYLNQYTILLWECKQGHRWKSKSIHMINGNHWCPECAGVKKGTIEQMHRIAKDRNGKCLSKEYTNQRTPLEWECKEGHHWWATPNDIKHSGYWCSECSGRKKLTIELMQTLATSKGGKCLSTEYINSMTKLLWQCKEGHKWRATPSKIKNAGQWCPDCYRDNRHNGQTKKRIKRTVANKT